MTAMRLTHYTSHLPSHVTSAYLGRYASVLCETTRRDVVCTGCRLLGMRAFAFHSIVTVFNGGTSITWTVTWFPPFVQARSASQASLDADSRADRSDGQISSQTCCPERVARVVHVQHPSTSFGCMHLESDLARAAAAAASHVAVTRAIEAPLYVLPRPHDALDFTDAWKTILLKVASLFVRWITPLTVNLYGRNSFLSNLARIISFNSAGSLTHAIKIFTLSLGFNFDVLPMLNPSRRLNAYCSNSVSYTSRALPGVRRV
jgi:hypothetical protein